MALITWPTNRGNLTLGKKFSLYRPERPTGITFDETRSPKLELPIPPTSHLRELDMKFV